MMTQSDLPMIVPDPPRRLTRRDRKLLCDIIDALAGRKELSIAPLMPDALYLADHKLKPRRRMKRGK